MTFSLANFWGAETLATTRVIDCEKESSYPLRMSFSVQRQGSTLGQEPSVSLTALS